MALPTINLSLIPVFPANVFGDGPITVDKSGLNYTLGWDIETFGVNPSPAASSLALVYNPESDTAELIDISGAPVDWDSILNKPATFPPSAHTHPIDEVTGLQAALEAKLDDSQATAAGLAMLGAVNAAAQAALISPFLGAGAPAGQCRLIKNGANLQLIRWDGTQLGINGTNNTIPSSGPTLAATGLTPGTVYFIYAYMNAGTMTLEASATGHSTDSTTGMEIKTGDATRTLVGMAQVVTGPAWADSITQRLVLSWFNRRPTTSRSADTSPTSGSTSFVELSTSARLSFLVWSGDEITVTGQTRVSDGTASQDVTMDFGLDGTTPLMQSPAMQRMAAAGSDTRWLTAVLTLTAAEGAHYITPLGRVSGGTGTWAVLSVELRVRG